MNDFVGTNWNSDRRKRAREKFKTLLTEINPQPELKGEGYIGEHDGGYSPYLNNYATDNAEDQQW